VRLVAVDEQVESAAIREVDLQNTYKHSPKVLADKLHLDTGRTKALGWELAIEDDPSCRHDFVFGKMKLPMYSDRALEKMRDAIVSGTDLNAVRTRYLASRH